MNNPKYLGAIALSLILAMTIVSCGNDASADNKAPADAEANTTAPHLEPSAAYKAAIAENFVDISYVTNLYVANTTPYITTQCYTKPKDDEGNRHNPCFTCHINDGSDGFVPNYFADTELQLSYDFATPAYTNNFSNLFKDRSDLVTALSDDYITQYVNEDNYFDANGTIILSDTLANRLPEAWDIDNDGQWSGYTPDCYFNFDGEGFDHAPDNSYTGWRAFRYSPFLGTFWPTNGSTDDVLIRLAEEFQQDENGDFNLTVYKINLAIVESLITFQDVAIDPVDENSVGGIDIDNNGIIGTASKVAFKAPYGLGMHYVGKMKTYLDNDIMRNVARGLYPKGTEFLHTVRYISSDPDGTISMAPRMKEVRWAKKVAYNNYGQVENVALTEIKERHDFPDRTKEVAGDSEIGLYNGLGWKYQGFIEDENGALRPQNYEETVYCLGCHGNLGAPTDSSFAFPRKLEGGDSWLHWSQKGLVGIPDRNITASTLTEYVHYLSVNHAGDEFRANEEVMAKFFDANGSLNANADTIKSDITQLLFPSHERALQLNKAYKIIVDEQSFIRGRDAHVGPLDDTVYREIEIDSDTGLEDAVSYQLEK